jgi:hypothetical protein
MRVSLSSNSFFITVIACSQCIQKNKKQLPKDVAYFSDICFHTTLLGLIYVDPMPLPHFKFELLP